MSTIKKIILTFTLFMIPVCVLADAAPMTLNKGGAIYGIENTEVEMSYEKVIFSNLRTEGLNSEPIYDVSAEFVMYNTGNDIEKIKVFFPFYFNENDYGYDFEFDKGVSDIEVFADSKMIDYIKDGEKEEILFDVVFYPKSKKKLVIKYENTFSPEYWSTYYDIGYILHTGALWKNSIGEGEIIFEFPYSIENQARFFYEKGQTDMPLNKDCTYGKYCYLDNKVIYKFKDFEPTKDDDILYQIFNPDAWQKFLKLKKKIADGPNNYEVHMEMAELYNYSFKDFEKEYFEEIDKALNIKYPQKNLEYYEEAGKYYSKEWSFFPNSKDYNFYYALDKIVEIRDDLYKISDVGSINARNELIDKIDFGLFRKCMSVYDDYKHPQEQEVKLEKPDFQAIMGANFPINDNFNKLINLLDEKGFDYYGDAAKSYFLDYKKGDYSFLNEAIKEPSSYDSTAIEANKKNILNNSTGENTIKFSYQIKLLVILLVAALTWILFIKNYPKRGGNKKTQ